MKSARFLAIAILGFVGIALTTTSALAGAAAGYIPPTDDTHEQARTMFLMADKMHGFAPMSVRLSGMMRTDEGNLIPLDGGQTIRLVVVSPFLSVQHSKGEPRIFADVRYEAITEGPKEPSAFKRVVELRKPGRYVFHVQVVDDDGTIVSSNRVSVKAL